MHAQYERKPMRRRLSLACFPLAWRARSATAAGGSVSAAFVSQSTKEGISETEGTMSPAGLAAVGPNLIIIDADLRPQLLRPGAAAFVPLWTSFRFW